MTWCAKLYLLQIHLLGTKQTIAFLDKVCEDKIQPFIDKSYNELAQYTNALAQKMFMKREVLADKGIWTAKKRYILNVYDNEGVKYAKPQVKIHGT
jgi:DNA polymerase elongation subunit (family B)